MNGPRPQPPYGVPTLTEVVETPFAAPARADDLTAPEPFEPGTADALVPPEVPAPAPVEQPPAMPAAEGPMFDEAELIERVLADLQRQVELMLEYRLREVLTPALLRATDALVRESRVELASTLRDVVARAVAQELLRHRGR